MKISFVSIDGYKNLKNFKVNFDAEKTVIVGRNASGKSNFLEALVLIFKNLDLGRSPEFTFEIRYTLFENQKDKEKKMIIKGFPNPDFRAIKAKAINYTIWDLSLEQNELSEEQINVLLNKNKGNPSWTEFIKNKYDYLPKHVFSYYSGLGNSNRLAEIHYTHNYNYAKKLMKSKGKSPEDRYLFDVQLHHSHFILLAFYGLELDKKIEKFLLEHLSIEGLESILFILKEPYWKRAGATNKFWGSQGIVERFLEDLYKIAVAPLRETRKQDINMWQSLPNEERLCLYISDIKKLQDLIRDNQWDNIQFFNVLESIKASDLHKDIRVRIRKNYAGNITFKDLSEGEQQLLTVLGLMRFTRYEESLYLLDEPDTHLNPYWQWQYMKFISEVADKPNTSQVIMTTHSPLTIGSLTKEEVRVFATSEGQIRTYIFDEDPRGMGVERLLTSQLFGLQTILDIPTVEKIQEKDELYNKKYYSDESLSDKEEQRLTTLLEELEYIGIKSADIDPIYTEFLRAYQEHFKMVDKELAALSPEEVEARNKFAEELLKSLLEKEEQEE